MSDAKPPLLHRLLKFGGITALVVAAAVWGVKAYLAGQAQKVVVITALDAATVAVNKVGFDGDGLSPAELREEVISIYGTKFSEEEVLFLDEAKLIRPEQDKELVLLPKDDSENVFKMDTVHFATPRVSIGAALTGLLMLGLLAFLRKRRNNSTA